MFPHISMHPNSGKHRKRLRTKVVILALLAAFVLQISNISAAADAPIPPASNAGQYDVLIYGGTASGVIAAVSAARSGASVALVEPTGHLGGMVSGGLSATDSGVDKVIGGLAREFFERVGAYYHQKIAWYFEPHVAEKVFNDMLLEAGVKVFLHHRLKEEGGVEKEGTRIQSITTENGDTFGAKEYIDCSYEGVLFARAGVSYTWGRESASQYQESLAGIIPSLSSQNFQYPLSASDETGKLLPGVSSEKAGVNGMGDSKIQAFNYRLCLTDKPANRLPLVQPPGYDPQTYKLLSNWLNQLKKSEKNRLLSLEDVFSIIFLPNGKADFNNSGPFSTDYVGGNTNFPVLSYAEQEKVSLDHKSYTQGLLYFIANDPSVPVELQQEMIKWGPARDEFRDNGCWPYQLYIRESRRMIGEYVMTQADLQKNLQKEDSIALGSYNIDSHNTQRLATSDGYVSNEGDMQIPVPTYEIPYRSILPQRKEATNLLVPVCLSASHVAYSSIRMEAQYMMLGQAAGIAAKLAVNNSCDVQDVDYAKLRFMLIVQKAVLDMSQAGRRQENECLYMDNRSAGFTQSGYSEGNLPGQTGSDVFVDSASAETDFAMYIPNILSDGDYNIYLNVPQGLWGTQKLEIHSNDKKYLQYVSLSTPGWVLVPGSPYTMKRGQLNFLELISGGSLGTSAADGVKFVLSGRGQEDDLAYGCPVTVDSTLSGYSSAFITDNNLADSSRWVSENTSGPHWAEINLAQKSRITGFALFAGCGTLYPVKNYKFQYWDGSGWSDLPETQSLSDSGGTVLYFCLNKPLETQKVRFVSQDSGYVRIKEIKVYGDSNP